MSYQCRREPKGFVVRHRGTVRSPEALEAKQCLYQGEQTDHARYQIIDFSQARAGDLLDADFDVACALDVGASTCLRHILVAFVVSNLDILTQTLRYIERAKTAGCDWSFRVFTDVEEARSWIALELGHH